MQPELIAQGGGWSSEVQLSVTCHGGGGEQIAWLLSDQDQILRNLGGEGSYKSTGRATRETVSNEWTGNASQRAACTDIRTLHPASCQATEFGWRGEIIIDVDF